MAAGCQDDQQGIADDRRRVRPVFIVRAQVDEASGTPTTRYHIISPPECCIGPSPFATPNAAARYLRIRYPEPGSFIIRWKI